jgi:hypothetical protein
MVGVSPGPEPFPQGPADGVNEQRVQVVNKEVLETINVDWVPYTEQVGEVPKCSHGSIIQEFPCRD